MGIEPSSHSPYVLEMMNDTHNDRPKPSKSQVLSPKVVASAVFWFRPAVVRMSPKSEPWAGSNQKTSLLLRAENRQTWGTSYSNCSGHPPVEGETVYRVRSQVCSIP